MSSSEPCTSQAQQSQPIDYTVPLHVDCSVEYELPDCAKPPTGVATEPLLIIHPCHFKNMERHKKRPFENHTLTKRRPGPSWEPYTRAQSRAWVPDPPYLPPPQMPQRLPCYEAV